MRLRIGYRRKLRRLHFHIRRAKPVARKWRRWPWLLALRTVFVLALVWALVYSFPWPLVSQETRPGWTVLPLWSPYVFAQNVGMWMDGRSYATEEVDAALRAAGEVLSDHVSGARIAFMDASFPQGGKMMLHLSHAKGVDVDILYIGRTPSGRLWPQWPSFSIKGYDVDYGANGRAGDLTFDRRANLWLAMSLLDQTECPVGKILVEPFIKNWLLAEARDEGLDDATWRRLQKHLRYAGPSAGRHDDHMHVHFACEAARAD